ncbi:MAG: saccharopine dehydrogenase C-terminal domain-containing protein [Bacillota bacterium]
MSYRYAVLGAGRQGTAAAYDMAKFGDASQVRIGDADLAAAEKSAARVNRLLQRDVAAPARVDVTDEAALVDFLRGTDAFLSAVPYWFNPGIARAAVKARASMCDLGGNTGLVFEQLKLDQAAADAGISLVPDCGQVPGMGNSLAAYAVSFFDRPEDILIWDGGIAQKPRPPFNYYLTFNIAGLTNEYYGTTHFLRDGKIVEMPLFTEAEYELVEFPEPIGTLEAFVAGGGTSTAPWTYEGKLKTYQNKTLRYPGHFRQWKTLIDIGFLEEEPVDFGGGVKLSPRHVLHTLFDPKLAPRPDDKDLVILRIKGRGDKEGRRAEVVLDVIDYFDEATGFTAMERTTGWHAAIVAILMAKGVTPRGARPVEKAVPGPLFAAEMKKRGIPLKETFTWL